MGAYVMPRFFFNVSDTKTLFDPEGTELPNWQAARIFAIRYIGGILQSDAKIIAESDEWHMDITDENGLVMMRLDFSILLSPVIERTSMLNDHHAIHLTRTCEGQPVPRNDR
jgi:hypothetical protein